MITFREHFVVDEQGKRIGVLLDMEDYRKLLEELEELESIRAYDAAKASNDQAVPLSKPSLTLNRIGGEPYRFHPTSCSEGIGSIAR